MATKLPSLQGLDGNVEVTRRPHPAREANDAVVRFRQPVLHGVAVGFLERRKVLSRFAVERTPGPAEAGLGGATDRRGEELPGHFAGL